MARTARPLEIPCKSAGRGACAALLALMLAACATAPGPGPEAAEPAAPLALAFEVPGDPLPVIPIATPGAEAPVLPEATAEAPPQGPWLEDPTETELAAAPPDLARIVRGFNAARAPLAKSDLEALVPGITRGERYVSAVNIPVSGYRVAFGAAFFARPLGEIRRRERDQIAILKAQDGDLKECFLEPGSYLTGTDARIGPWTSYRIIQRAGSRLFCAAFELRMRTLERWENERLVVTARDEGTNTHHFRSRDLWFPVVDEAGFHGWALFSALGFDLKDCPDRDANVRGAIRDAFEFLDG